MEYTELTVDEQKNILQQRKRQYEAEHYNHVINKELLTATGATDDQTKAAIKAADDAMKTLDNAHAATKKKLADLEKSSK
jgi:hypothetical protein